MPKRTKLPQPKMPDKPAPKVGRPTTLTPELQEQVLAQMKEGFSLEAAAGGIGVSRETIHRWMDANPEFRDAVGAGRTSARKWWENVGRGGATGALPKFNYQAWMFSMKNMFKWQDATRVEVLSDPTNTDATKQKLEAMTKSFESLLQLEKERLGVDDNGDIRKD